MIPPKTIPHEGDQLPWLIIVALAALIVFGLIITLSYLR